LKQLKLAWLKQSSTLDETVQKEATRRALTTLCHTILNSADFLYVD
jgi:hypothetical protein